MSDTAVIVNLLKWCDKNPDSGLRLDDGTVIKGRDMTGVIFSLQDKISRHAGWEIRERQRANTAEDALRDMTESRDEWEEIANEYKAKLELTPLPAPVEPRGEAVALREVIEWALGERDEFPNRPERVEGKPYPHYYWRTELRRRYEAALTAAPVAAVVSDEMVEAAIDSLAQAAASAFNAGIPFLPSWKETEAALTAALTAARGGG